MNSLANVESCNKSFYEPESVRCSFSLGLVTCLLLLSGSMTSTPHERLRKDSLSRFSGHLRCRKALKGLRSRDCRDRVVGSLGCYNNNIQEDGDGKEG